MGRDAPDRGPSQRDTMGMMDEPVENCIAKGGVADQIVPVIDRDLACHQRGPAVGAIFHDFEHVAPFAIAEGRKPPVIQKQ